MKSRPYIAAVVVIVVVGVLYTLCLSIFLIPLVPSFFVSSNSFSVHRLLSTDDAHNFIHKTSQISEKTNFSRNLPVNVAVWLQVKKFSFILTESFDCLCFNLETFMLLTS